MKCACGALRNFCAINAKSQEISESIVTHVQAAYFPSDFAKKY